MLRGEIEKGSASIKKELASNNAALKVFISEEISSATATLQDSMNTLGETVAAMGDDINAAFTQRMEDMVGSLKDKVDAIEDTQMTSSADANESIAAAIGALADDMRATGSSSDTAALAELNKSMVEMASNVNSLLKNCEMQANQAGSLDGVKQMLETYTGTISVENKKSRDAMEKMVAKLDSMEKKIDAISECQTAMKGGLEQLLQTTSTMDASLVKVRKRYDYPPLPFVILSEYTR